jgi:P27 family predicted phage terminase small subunit
MALLKAAHVEDVVPKAPRWLKDRALDKWQELWGSLLDRNHISPTVHGDLVALYCESYGSFREAVEKLASMGSLVKDKNDRVVPNPYVDIRDTAMRQMTDIGERLGLMPSAGVRYSDFAPTAQEPSNDRTDTGDAGGSNQNPT